MENYTQRSETLPVHNVWFNEWWEWCLTRIKGIFWPFIVCVFLLFVIFGIHAITNRYKSTPLYHGYTDRLMDEIMKDKKLKLPFDVIPISYNLSITPILKENLVNGDLIIHLRCNKATTGFRLHSSKSISEIYDVSLKYFKSKRVVQLYYPSFLDDQKFYEIHTRQRLEPDNEYLLYMKFVSNINHALYGKSLFKDYYIDPITSEFRWIVISNLSPTFAREVFPCFDEPALKATFNISIGREYYMRSRSNSELELTKPISNMPNYVWDQYKTTRPMSTYTLAIMVTDFVHYTLDSFKKVTFNVISRQEVQEQTKYVASTIPRLINKMEELTGIPYNLEKLDVIVVPHLGYSGMENWGLIAIRENNILVDKNSRFNEQKQLKKFVLAHEIAHQWFGNLITPVSWTEVWIKEGFASFFAYNILQNMSSSSWSVEYRFNDVQRWVFSRIFEINIISEQPLRNNSIPVEEVFNQILYQKSSSIVNMIFHSLSKEVFLKSIKKLFELYSEGNPKQDIICDVFQLHITKTNFFPPKVTMKTFVRSWTDQKGFPIVDIIRDFDKKVIIATQKPFQYTDFEGDNSRMWIIPLTWTTRDERNFDTITPKVWLTEKMMQFQDPSFDFSCPTNQWILLNINQTGHYRVNYDKENWKLLLNDYDKFPKLTRMQLISDVIAIAGAGYIDYKYAWMFLNKLKNEDDLFTWTTIIKNDLQSLMNTLYFNASFRNVMSKLVDKVYNVVIKEFNSTTNDEKMEYQEIILKFACSMDHEACLKLAKYTVDNLINSTKEINIPKRPQFWAYCAAMKTATISTWLKLQERYLDAPDQEKRMIATALGCLNSTVNIHKYLDWIMTNNEEMPSIDMQLAFSSISKNIYGINIIKPFIFDNLKKIKSIVNNEGNINQMVVNLSQYGNSEADLNWLDKLQGVINRDVLESCKDHVKRNKKRKEESEMKIRHIPSYGNL